MLRESAGGIVEKKLARFAVERGGGSYMRGKRAKTGLLYLEFNSLPFHLHLTQCSRNAAQPPLWEALRDRLRNANMLFSLGGMVRVTYNGTYFATVIKPRALARWKKRWFDNEFVVENVGAESCRYLLRRVFANVYISKWCCVTLM
jgi:hypothetical protein